MTKCCQDFWYCFKMFEEKIINLFEKQSLPLSQSNIDNLKFKFGSYHNFIIFKMFNNIQIRFATDFSNFVQIQLNSIRQLSHFPRYTNVHAGLRLKIAQPYFFGNSWYYKIATGVTNQVQNIFWVLGAIMVIYLPYYLITLINKIIRLNTLNSNGNILFNFLTYAKVIMFLNYSSFFINNAYYQFLHYNKFVVQLFYI